MKKLKEVLLKNGKRQVTLELEENESFLVVDERSKLAIFHGNTEPEDIYPAEVILSATPVTWCYHAQKWVYI